MKVLALLTVAGLAGALVGWWLTVAHFEQSAHQHRKDWRRYE